MYLPSASMASNHNVVARKCKTCRCLRICSRHFGALRIGFQMYYPAKINEEPTSGFRGVWDELSKTKKRTYRNRCIGRKYQYVPYKEFLSKCSGSIQFIIFQTGLPKTRYHHGSFFSILIFFWIFFFCLLKKLRIPVI